MTPPPETVPVAPRVDEPVAPPALAPLDLWHAGSGQLEGLAADFAAMATGADWRDDALEVGIPSAGAVSFLNRPEVAAALARALADAAGRPVRCRVVAAAAPTPADPTAAETAAPARPVAVATQAALVRQVADHPLVTHVRGVFDAAIRRVEPARPRAEAAPRPSETADDGEPDEAVAHVVGVDGGDADG